MEIDRFRGFQNDMRPEMWVVDPLDKFQDFLDQRNGILQKDTLKNEESAWNHTMNDPFRKIFCGGLFPSCLG